MPKRHKPAKKSKQKHHVKKAKKLPSRPRTKIQESKRGKQSPKRGGSKSVKDFGRKGRPRIQEPTVVAKGASIYKRRTPEPLRRKKGSRTGAKKKGNTPLVTKRKKATGKVQTSIRKSSSRKIKTGYVEKVRRRKQIEQQIEDLKREAENLQADLSQVQPDFSNKFKPKTKRSYQLDKDGKRVKEKNVKGFRFWYELFFPKGDFESKMEFMRNADLSFLNHALKRNVKEPRAVFISLHSEFDKIVVVDEDNFRTEKINLFDGHTSDETFIVNLINIKMLIIDKMLYWQDNFSERLYQQGQSYLDKSGEEYNPDNLVSVSFRFIY
jgi:hypothetical protein